MEHDDWQSLVGRQKAQAPAELEQCNELSLRYGLRLTDAQMEELTQARFRALRETGRVEFGRGILKELIAAFCDSPYLTQQNYAETLFELQDSFYYFKNESENLLSDEELIAAMARYFNGFCQGSLDCLSGTSLEELCRRTRSDGADGDGFLF